MKQSRRRFLATALALIPVGLMAKKPETLQQAIDRGGLIEGKHFVVTEPLIATNDHNFHIRGCEIDVRTGGRPWIVYQRDKPKHNILITECTINFGSDGGRASYGMYDGAFRSNAWRDRKTEAWI